jgi:hypothetical protein
MTDIKLLHVWALEFHPQGVSQSKEMQTQHFNLVTALTVFELLTVV